MSRGPIRLKAVVERLRVSQRALGRTADMSPTAVNAALNLNAWPVRANRQRIQDAWLELCRKAGASDADLSQAFELAARQPLQKAKRPTSGKTKAASHPTSITKESHDMLAKQSLTRQAMAHFELFTNPFDGEVTSSDEMFSSPDIAYCREVCWQAAMHARFCAIVGESGAGKTTLLGDLQERILVEDRKIHVIKPSVLGMEDGETTGKPLKQGDVMDALIWTLQPGAAPKQKMEARSRQLEELLITSQKAGFRHLLVIEEAHALPTATLRHFKRLLELRYGRNPLLGVVLLGQPELLQKLNTTRHDMREVVQRCEIVELPPLDTHLRTYLQVRAQRAQKRVDELFADDLAVAAIEKRLTVSKRVRDASAVREAKASMVYPLAVNNLVTAAMNRAAEVGVPRLTSELILSI